MRIVTVKTLLILFVAAIGWSTAAGADRPPAPPSDPVAASPQRKERIEAPQLGDTGPLLREFNQARQTYLARRIQLEKALQKATEQQRQALREQLKLLREEQLRARENLRQQLQELRERLPDHHDLIDQAQERSGNRPRRGD
jgi:hypothetical protein